MIRDDKGRFALNEKSTVSRVKEYYKICMDNNTDRENAQLYAMKKFNLKMSSAVNLYTAAKKEYDEAGH